MHIDALALPDIKDFGDHKGQVVSWFPRNWQNKWNHWFPAVPEVYLIRKKFRILCRIALNPGHLICWNLWTAWSTFVLENAFFAGDKWKRIVSHWLFSGTAAGTGRYWQTYPYYWKKDLTDRNAVVSIQTPEIDMSQVAWQLDNEYGVMTRVGLHCAPNAHKTLGTYPAGTIRFSFGPENTKNELDFAIQGLKKILDL